MKKNIFPTVILGFSLLSLSFRLQNTYHKYCNARFEYCIEYPTELIGMGESDNGDGQEFVSNDKKANLKVSRDWRDADYGPTARCKMECFKSDSKSSNGKNVTYKKEGADFFVVSGTKGNNIFYQKTIIKNTGMITAVIEYDAIKKTTYDRYCTYLFKTFK